MCNLLTETRMTFRASKCCAVPSMVGGINPNGSKRPFAYLRSLVPFLRQPCPAMNQTNGSNNSCNANTSLNPILSYFATKSEISSWRSRIFSPYRVQSPSVGTSMVNSGICSNCCGREETFRIQAISLWDVRVSLNPGGRPERIMLYRYSRVTLLTEDITA